MTYRLVNLYRHQQQLRSILRKSPTGQGSACTTYRDPALLKLTSDPQTLAAAEGRMMLGFEYETMLRMVDMFANVAALYL